MEARLTLLKVLLGIPADDSTKDGLLQFVLSDAEQGILNYCNISELPPDLETTLIRIAADIWRNEGYGLGEDERKVVHSVSDGDQSVTYEASQTKSTGTAAIVRKYAPSLTAFRRLRGWDG